MFEKCETNKLSYKTSQLPSNKTGKYSLPALTAGIQNQGLNNYVPEDNATKLKNVISVSANGANTGATFFQSKEFTVLQDAYAIKWKDQKQAITERMYLFLTSCISKAIFGNYEWTNKAGWNRIKDNTIKLPIKNNSINFNFMEEFIAELEARQIAELEAYLEVTGLKNYKLTKAEKDAISNYGSVNWKMFNLKELFGEATRGKRLKSFDRIPGELPFVTAGEEAQGVSAYIGNTVQIFEKNTVTIDMFGSAKYRNYKYGADDHVAVVHTEELEKMSVLFIATSIHKAAHTGEFSYDKNFYAKDADELYIKLPVLNGMPDYHYMGMLISGIQKMIIREVVKNSEKRRKATIEVINSN